VGNKENSVKTTTHKATAQRGSIKKTLTLICTGLVLVTLLVLGAISIIGIRKTSTLALNDYNEAMYDGYKTEIKSQIQAAITIVQHYYDMSQAGTMTVADAQYQAKEAIRAMRYRDDGSGYMWIDDTNYNLVMHPILPQQEGNNRYNLEDQNGVMIIQEIMKAANAGGGYNTFWFTKSDGVTVAEKLAYSEKFEPWNWVITTGNYTDDMELEMAEVSSSINKSLVSIIASVVICAIIVLVVAVIFSLGYAERICNPLKQLQGMADKLSDGDLTSKLDIKSNNEIGATADSLMVAQEHFVNLISDIEKVSFSLSDAISDFDGKFASMGESIGTVSSAIGDIAQNSTEQASSTSIANNGIISIGTGIRNTSNEAESLRDNASDMMELSEKSLQTLRNLIAANEKSMEDITSMQEQTNITSSSVSRIGEATTLIDGISSQTNLLALNASIEAARAGEAGRGFAVVAEEIGHLATQSADTVKEINSTIYELVENSDSLVKTMDAMTATAKQQETALRDTAETFQKLQDTLSLCVKSVNVITESIEDVNGQKDLITEKISMLNDIASDNAASSEETSSVALELEQTVATSSEKVHVLADSARQLVESLKRFTL
jgi:methyl-accepting chemotaxis protein